MKALILFKAYTSYVEIYEKCAKFMVKGNTSEKDYFVILIIRIILQ